MDERAVWSTFRARSGREADVEAFLAECRAGIERETGTTVFFVLKIGPGSYGTFASFKDDAAVEMHLHGPTAAAVKARAADLFEGDLAIVQAAILGAKPTEAGR